MMTELTIKTNYVPRDLIYGFELSETELAEFDYLEEPENAEFFRYRGQVYDLGEFMRVPDNVPEFGDWQGYASDTFFSGVLIKYAENYERVIVARYYS